MPAPLIFSPMMRINLKRSTLLSLAAAITVSGLFVGCKKPAEQADEAVATAVDEAQQAIDNTGDSAVALQKLGAPLKNTAASSVSKSIVNMAAGNAEVMAADSVLAKIDLAQNHLERLIGRVSEMTGQLSANDQIIAGLSLKEPTKALAAIDKTATNAKTGQAGVWYPGDAAIPALEALNKSSADLTAKIDALKTQHADMEKKRAEALVAAEKLSQQSELAKGKQSVDLYVQAANERKTASQLSTQLQTLDAELAERRRDVSVVKAQQDQIQASLKKFTDETQQVNAGWESVKQRISAVVAKSKGIVEGGLPDDMVEPTTAPTTSPTTGPTTLPSEPPVKSLTAAGDEIAKVLADLAALRKDAKDHLDKADGYYATVGKLHKEISSTYQRMITERGASELATKPAWQLMVEINNDYDPALLRAQVAQRMARLYADEYFYSNTLLIAEKDAVTALAPADAAVKAALDSAKVELPKTLDPTPIEPQVKAAKQGANDAFAACEKDLDEITSKTGNTDTAKSLIELAKIVQMIEQYGHWAFANASADAADKDKADPYKKKATELALELTKDVDLDYLLPLPPEIAPAPDLRLTSGTPTSTSSTQTAEATTNPANADTPDQADVRAVLTQMSETLNGDDVAKAKTFIVPNTDEEAQIDVDFASHAALHKALTAAEQKFGTEPQAKTYIDGMRKKISDEVAASIARSQITVVGDTATVMDGADDPDPQKFTKVNGAWKLQHGSPSPRRMAELAAEKKMTPELEGLATDIQQGKVANFADFAKALGTIVTTSGLPEPRHHDAGPAAAPNASTTAPAAAPTTAESPATVPATPETPATPPTTPAAPQATPPASAPATSAPAAPGQ